MQSTERTFTSRRVLVILSVSNAFRPISPQSHTVTKAIWFFAHINYLKTKTCFTPQTRSRINRGTVQSRLHPKSNLNPYAIATAAKIRYVRLDLTTLLIGECKFGWPSAHPFFSIFCSHISKMEWYTWDHTFAGFQLKQFVCWCETHS